MKAILNCLWVLNCASLIFLQRFPIQDKPRLQIWVDNMKREEWTPSRHQYLCSEHFTEDCFDIRWGIRYLKNRAIPTIFPAADDVCIFLSASSTDICSNIIRIACFLAWPIFYLHHLQHAVCKIIMSLLITTSLFFSGRREKNDY